MVDISSFSRKQMIIFVLLDVLIIIGEIFSILDALNRRNYLLVVLEVLLIFAILWYAIQIIMLLTRNKPKDKQDD